MPAWIAELCLWTFGVALAVVVAHWGFWKLVRPKFDDQQHEAARWGAVRIGAVHAFILAFVFADARQEYNELAETIDNEALAIEQLFRGLDGIEDDSARVVQSMIARYTQLVIEQEWISQAQGRPLEEADRLVDAIYVAVIALTDDGKSSGLARSLLDDVNDIENARGQRSFDISEPVSGLFWLIAVAGFVFTASCYLVFAPGLLKSSILAMYSAINGLIFFAILSFTSPFSGAVKVGPGALETVMARTIEVR